MAAVTLRTASGADAPAIAALFLEARRAMTYLPVVHTDAEAARFFFALIMRAHVEVAEEEGLVVAFAAVHDGWFEQLNVLPACQGRGIGHRLIGWAKEISPVGLDLWVFERNTRAHALYRSEGWPRSSHRR